MIRLCLLSVALWIMQLCSIAQSDTTFWFAAPDLQQGHGDRPILLRFSTGASPATVTVNLPANTGFTPLTITIAANSSQSLDLTPYINEIENAVPNLIENRGLKISSTAMVSCYYDIAHGFNGDIYALKGANGVGFKFTLPFQMAFTGAGLPNYTCTFSIVATEDNTTVTITPKNDLLGHAAGVPFSVTLNKGQTYTCQAATDVPSQRPGGTLVVASKPISISTKDDTIRYPGQGCGDTAGDQLIPDCNAGNSFIIPRGQLNGPDYYYVFAINNNTTVSVNGSVVATIDAGNYYMGTLSSPSCYVQTSSPAHVFHLSGFGCELGGAVVPSIDNEGSSFIGVTRASASPFYINVLSVPGNIGGFSVNGSSTVVQAADFFAVPGTNGNWMLARVPINTSVANAGQNIRIQNSIGKFHIGVIHGDVSSTTRYGYFSDFERVNINLSQYDTLYCKGTTVSVTASATGAADFQWTGPNGFTSTGPLLQLTNFQAAQEGFYTVSATTSRCGYVERKVWVGLQTPVADFTNPVSQCLAGPGSQFASTSTVNAGQLSTFNWSFGDGNSATGSSVAYQYNTAGTYSVKLLVISSKLCRDSIEKVFTVQAAPSTVIVPTGPLRFCEGQSLTLNSTNQPGSGTLTQYQWNLNGAPLTGATGVSWVVAQSGDYTLEVQNSNGCKKLSSPVTVTIDPLPNGTLTTPTNTKICEGATLSLNATGGNTYQWYLNTLPLGAPTGSTLAASLPGVYTVELISAQGCRNNASGSVTLGLIRKPAVDFSHDVKCAWVVSTFTNLSTTDPSGAVNWAWDFGDATSSAMLSPTHTYQQSGTYSVSLTATPVDCPNQVTTSIKNVVVEQRVQDIRYPIVNAVSNQPVRLQARSFGAEYSWSPGTGLSSAMVVNPVFRHDQSLEYLITIKTLGSCVTVDTLQVRVFKFIDILLPNAFTPNNDGLNDKLEFFLIGIEQFKFLRIFNRWGQLVFETNNEKTFWNGAKNGSLQPSDVYVWVAEGIGVDGSKVARKGTVTLIKK
jgi:gliding motility-associated-like protein